LAYGWAGRDDEWGKKFGRGTSCGTWKLKQRKQGSDIKMDGRMIGFEDRSCMKLVLGA
jgi:hypothetical protein